VYDYNPSPLSLDHSDEMSPMGLVQIKTKSTWVLTHYIYIILQIWNTQIELSLN